MVSISVVMPTYNRADYIEKALDSLMQQTEKPVEIIVVDDGSTDDTEERVRRHALGSRIQYKHQSNQGASVARNLGVQIARGDLIVFLDSDDMLEPLHHEVALSVLKGNRNVALFCCDSRSIGVHGEWLNGGRSWTEVQCLIKRCRIETGVRTLQDIFLFSTPFPGFTVRREAYREVGGLDQSIFPLDDYDLQLKIAGAGYGVHYEHRSLARYRVHEDNESGRNRAVRVGEQKLRCLERALSTYAEIRRLGPTAKRRMGEAKRELGLSMLRDGQVLGGAGQLARSLSEDPWGVGEIARIATRKLRSFIA